MLSASTRLRRCLAAVLAAAVAAALGIVRTPPLHAQAAARPNVLVILTDDMDISSLKVALAGGLMPNLRTYFMSRGINFSQAFTVAALGGPSRATFLTGRYPHNHGVVNNFGPAGGILRLDETQTLATWLKAAGYHTGLAGRHVTGYGWWTPEADVPPGWDEWYGLIDPGTLSTRQYKMNLNGAVTDFGLLAAVQNRELYQTDMVSFFATSFIERNAAIPNQPFFLEVTPVVFQIEEPPFNDCPGPGFLGGSVWGASEQPPSRYLNTVFGSAQPLFRVPTPPSLSEPDVSDKPDWVQANPMMTAADFSCLQKRYWRKLEVMRSLDDLVGSVMGALQASGAMQNTYVFFTSDNGFMDGQHRFPQKTPPYEESMRVPLIMLAPAHTAFTTISSMVLNTDLAPTILDIAHATPTFQPDGRSLLPLIDNPATPWRTMALFEHTPDDTTESLGVTGPPAYEGIRTLLPSPHMYTEYSGVTTGVTGEYYDLTADPYELSNLYATAAAQSDVQYLHQWLTAMETCKGLTCLIYEHYFQPPPPPTAP